jgi:hypothetical protein
MVDSQPLPSWNDGAAKSAILDFVARVTKQGGAEFVPSAGRIATFDNDGTLWCEQPLQTQFFFAFDRVKQLSATDSTISERQPFKAVLEDCNASLACWRSLRMQLTGQAAGQERKPNHAGREYPGNIHIVTFLGEWALAARFPRPIARVKAILQASAT